GGCNLIASYPMSPATGVLTFLAQQAREFGIVVEQIEDEIAAMNVAVGAGYAGARAMVSTSGGGFALMSEGLSLAGVMEIPVVVHLGQRPGPATGMATRTEQGDLELAIYSGHGEFPRMVLAASSIEDAFELTSRAFYLADKFQIQVIMLTDQYFLNTFYNVPAFDLKGVEDRSFLVNAHEGYRRYENTESGISPRAVPGSGPEIVGVDSHEHDEWGHVKEDFEMRTRMVDKRLRKFKAMSGESVSSLFSGQEDYDTLVISWGSTYPMVREALEILDRPGIAHLHIRQVFPLSEDILQYMSKASRLIMIEGNATGQMAKHLKLHTGYVVDERILNYRGLQFSVEEIREALEGLTG
ncbi:MAG: 2-oxoacid:acceptor oxidoreductase subunit alpha, partial [Synergistales bacterium]|nr:2-oxoacid:acceptor oxidoreductase subunit alpha [Synergistales bacterium]